MSIYHYLCKLAHQYYDFSAAYFKHTELAYTFIFADYFCLNYTWKQSKHNRPQIKHIHVTTYL